jgi:hypothetical protein
MIESKRIAQSNLTDTLTTLYTVPTDKTLIIRNLSLVNLSAESRTVDLVILPEGENFGNQHYYFKNISLRGNETKVFDNKLILESGDALQTKCSITGDVTIQVFGGEYSAT